MHDTTGRIQGVQVPVLPIRRLLLVHNDEMSAEQMEVLAIYEYDYAHNKHPPRDMAEA